MTVEWLLFRDTFMSALRAVSRLICDRILSGASSAFFDFTTFRSRHVLGRAEVARQAECALDA
jgi:hypothetical protein